MTTLAPSHYLAQQLANAVCRGNAFVPPEGLYVTLSLQPINAGMTGASLSEPMWPGYVRVQVGPNEWGAFENGVIKSKVTLLFAYNGLQTTFLIKALAITDAPVGGNLLYFYNFAVPLEIPYSVPPSLPSGRLVLRFAESIG